MKKLLILIVASAAMLAGCDSMDADAPTSLGLTEASGSAQSMEGETTTLNGYTIEFLGAIPAGTGTRFSYKVTGVNPGPPNLDWFFLENACGDTPILDPSNAVKETKVNGVPGFQWQASVTSSRTYSYTFPGSLETRIVRAAISRGNVVETAVVPGPCGGYAIEGSVTIGTVGIDNVLVEVSDASGPLYKDLTDDGEYKLFVIAPGNYTVSIPPGADGTVNGVLHGGSYSGSTSQGVSDISEDLLDVDFVFNPDKGKIITDLSTAEKDGGYQTKAQGVKFWQSVLRATARGKCVASPYANEDPICPAEVASILDTTFFSVSGSADSIFYLLTDPFSLTGTDPFKAAQEELSKPIRTELEQVGQNLFAMQLNLFRGWGTPDRAYDDALMTYLEQYVAPRSTAARGTSSISTQSVSATAAGDELTITQVYLGGGGGGTIKGSK